MNIVTRFRRLPKLARCGLKLRYYSKQEAKKAAKYYKRNHGWKQEPYWCDIHGCYHLTSIEK